ncbi:unnamed protein product [Mytilus coruscus]|uniref:Uncharacterized protein n=1 Tax=Mytilus coruscus TaxID=42192 RepID=A0A6J8CFZ1_MYTCO|nr:unnamed protein product [Mytilus coruscus]
MKFAIATVAILVCLCGMKGIYADDYYGGSYAGEIGVQGYGSGYGKGGYGSSYGGYGGSVGGYGGSLGGYGGSLGGYGGSFSGYGGSMGGYGGYSGYGKGHDGYSSYDKKTVHGYGKKGGYIDETIHLLPQPVPMSVAGPYAGGISSYGGDDDGMLGGIFGGGESTMICKFIL